MSFIPYNICPVWEALGAEQLLQWCLITATQNLDESLNNLIWARAPRTEFVGKATVDLMVSQAEVTFNSGYQQALLPVLEGVGAQPGPSCLSCLAGKDACHISQAKSNEAAVAKL